MTTLETTSRIRIKDQVIGGEAFVVVAGPCSIESLEQFSSVATQVKTRGASFLRGGIFKLRTRPDAFQGLGPEAYGIAREVVEKSGLPLISEITDPRQIDSLGEVVDIFQVGTRNMYNYELLKELGRISKPVLLKRGFSATISEWLLAAEYITRGGNNNIILCERGIRTFEDATRNTLDLSAVAYVKNRTSFPVFVDPSHGTGVRDLILPMSLASAAAGADGLLLEVHHTPEASLSDAAQALSLDDFENLMGKLRLMLPTIGRRLS